MSTYLHIQTGIYAYSILRSHYMINIDTKNIQFFLLNKTLVQTTPNENKKNAFSSNILAWTFSYYIYVFNGRCIYLWTIILQSRSQNKAMHLYMYECYLDSFFFVCAENKVPKWVISWMLTERRRILFLAFKNV